MTTNKTPIRRLIAGAGALALALGSAAAAFGAPGPEQQGASGEGSLTIHKRVGAQGAAGTGEELAAPTGTPLDGAEFTIWRLGVPDGDDCVAVDLGTIADWDLVPTGAAPATLAGVETAGFCAEVLDSGITGEDVAGSGEVRFDELPLGLYYVQETDAPANIVAKAAPFYVAVPMPKADNTGWLYDVHVYPKNQELQGPTKTINEDNAQTAFVVGSTVEWTIEQVIPALNAGEDFESASIWDTLSEGLANPATVSVQVAGVDLAYTPVYDDATRTITWTITGLDDLVEGETITVKFTTQVVEVTEDGEIVNAGNQYGSEFNGGKTPGEPDPRTYWGQLSILKTDDSVEPLLLAGAQFQVFLTNAAGTCEDEAPATGALATGESDNNGVVQWDGVTPSDVLGLWIANSDGELPTAPTRDYCLYETVVPQGHEADQSGQVITIEAGSENVLEKTIVNVKRDTPDLPLTGGSGTIALMTSGIVLFGAGMAVMIVARRRRVMAS